jgi:mRNA-degrading endonuclease RelE of RelBE toxin-antitoxin system
MPIRRTARFDRAYLGLPASIRAKVDRAISLLDEDWRHPGLHARWLSGHSGMFYARVDQSYRITYERHGDTLVLRTVGRHDETLKNP